MRKLVSSCAIASIVALSACSLTGGAEEPSGEAARQRAFEAGAQALEQGDWTAAAGLLAPVAAICPVDATGRRAMLLLATGELDPRNAGGRADAAAELAAFQVARPGGAWEDGLARSLYTLALDYGATPIEPGDMPGADVVWNRYLADAHDAFAAEQGQPLGADSPAVRPDAAAARQAGAEQPGGAAAAVAAPATGGPRCHVPEPDPTLALPVLDGAAMVVRAAQPPVAGAPPPAPTEGQDVRALMAEVERLRGEVARKDQELERIRRTLRP